MALGDSCLVAIVALVLTGIPLSSVSAEAISRMVGRDPAAWPLDTHSPWNYPIGSRAVFAPTRILLTGGYANIERYSTPVYVASLTAPLVKIYDRQPYYRTAWPPETGAVKGNLVSEIRISSNSPPAWGDDGVMVVVDPAKVIAYEFYRVAFISPDGRHLSWKNNNWGYRSGELSAGKAIFVDIKGSGLSGRWISDPGVWDAISAYGGSLTGGVIRRGELKNGIPHAIRFAAPGDFLSKYAPKYQYPTWPWYSWVWPASASDHPDGYTGSNNVYMGSLLAVPGWISENSLGLQTLEGRMVFRALQNYGGYITDKGILQSGHLVTQVDPQARGDIPDVNAFNADLARIFRALQVVANSHDNGGKPSWGPGGGGTPRRPLAPPFAQQGRR